MFFFLAQDVAGVSTFSGFSRSGKGSGARKTLYKHAAAGTPRSWGGLAILQTATVHGDAPVVAGPRARTPSRHLVQDRPQKVLMPLRPLVLLLRWQPSRRPQSPAALSTTTVVRRSPVRARAGGAAIGRRDVDRREPALLRSVCVAERQGRRSLGCGPQRRVLQAHEPRLAGGPRRRPVGVSVILARERATCMMYVVCMLLIYLRDGSRRRLC